MKKHFRFWLATILQNLKQTKKVLEENITPGQIRSTKTKGNLTIKKVLTLHHLNVSFLVYKLSLSIMYSLPRFSLMRLFDGHPISLIHNLQQVV